MLLPTERPNQVLQPTASHRCCRGCQPFAFEPNHDQTATPLIEGDRLFTVGSRVVLHCFDKKTGQVLWRHDLADELGVRIDSYVGHSCSPIAYRNLLILGLRGAALIRRVRGTYPARRSSSGNAPQKS